MGWQEDLARTNDPYLMTPSAVRKSAAASNARRNITKQPDDDAKSGFLANLRGDAGDMWGDVTGPVRESGLYGDASQLVGDLYRAGKKGLGSFNIWPTGMFANSVAQNMAQNEENERILGDLYTDDLRKTMVPNWDVSKLSPEYKGSRREYHDKYMELARLEDDPHQKEYYENQAKSAYRNANVTRRVNYALGDI